MIYQGYISLVVVAMRRSILPLEVVRKDIVIDSAVGIAAAIGERGNAIGINQNGASEHLARQFYCPDECGTVANPPKRDGVSRSAASPHVGGQWQSESLASALK
jgi:hypothetical protein